MGGPDPPKFLRNGPSPKSAIYELGLYEAAVGELTQPAMSRRALLRFDARQQSLAD